MYQGRGSSVSGFPRAWGLLICSVPAGVDPRPRRPLVTAPDVALLRDLRGSVVCVWLSGNAPSNHSPAVMVRHNTHRTRKERGHLKKESERKMVVDSTRSRLFFYYFYLLIIKKYLFLYVFFIFCLISFDFVCF